ncbi:hypothetical protein F5Y01DRAFT_302432 [Xylaria sp. FL0043]|nr:hypothetical protein F5Y01DRAFT_302432 [Xylaria sp. FL0043]
MKSPNIGLFPPFSKANSLRSSDHILLPHAFRQDAELLDPRRHINTYLKTDLEPTRLNKMSRHIWLAGLPRPARCLHRQRLLMRTILLTELPDEHLVWHDTDIWIKPIPEYLLSFDFWEKELCHDETLYKSAYGLLLSYTWLIVYKSDHSIAVDAGLVPADVDYNAWTALARDVSTRTDLRTPIPVNERYDYGELRLSRLNHLYRVGAAGFSLWNTVFGFTSRSTRYPAFFQRNFGWIFGVFVYFSVLLSAMQVALATEKLGSSIGFQSFSRAIALLSVAFVLLAAAIMLLVWSFLFGFHLMSTLQYLKRVKTKRSGRHSSTAI